MRSFAIDDTLAATRSTSRAVDTSVCWPIAVTSPRTLDSISLELNATLLISQNRWITATSCAKSSFVARAISAAESATGWSCACCCCSAEGRRIRVGGGDARVAVLNGDCRIPGDEWSRVSGVPAEGMRGCRVRAFVYDGVDVKTVAPGERRWSDVARSRECSSAAPVDNGGDAAPDEENAVDNSIDGWRDARAGELYAKAAAPAFANPGSE